MFGELNTLLHVEKYKTVLAYRKESINGDFLKKIHSCTHKYRSLCWNPMKVMTPERVFPFTVRETEKPGGHP